MSKKPNPTPTYRSPSGRYLDIALLVKDLRRTPGVWRLAFPDAPHATYAAIRSARHVDLRSLTDGRVEAEFRNDHIGPTGRRGDVYCRWVAVPQGDRKEP